MKVLGIIGSRRKKGNTFQLVNSVLKGAENQGAETQLIFLGDYNIAPCIGCEGCKDSFRCVINDDMQKIYPLLDEADGIVLGSPTYWYNVTSDMKAFIDRCYSLIIYPEHDRRIWASAFEDLGKCGVPLAVCEQHEENMMGFTFETLKLVLNDLDIKVVDGIKALGYFKPGEVLDNNALLTRAHEAGERLITAIKLKEAAKEHYLLR